MLPSSLKRWYKKPSKEPGQNNKIYEKYEYFHLKTYPESLVLYQLQIQMVSLCHESYQTSYHWSGSLKNQPQQHLFQFLTGVSSSEYTVCITQLNQNSHVRDGTCYAIAKYRHGSLKCFIATAMFLQRHMW